MEITTLIHDERYSVNLVMKDKTINYLQNEFFIQTREQLGRTELAVFLITLGGSMLVFRDAQWDGSNNG